MIDHKESLASEPDYKQWLLKSSDTNRNSDFDVEFDEKRQTNAFDFVDFNEGGIFSIRVYRIKII
jgi:hypothetical protein